MRRRIDARRLPDRVVLRLGWLLIAFANLRRGFPGLPLDEQDLMALMDRLLAEGVEPDPGSCPSELSNRQERSK